MPTPEDDAPEGFDSEPTHMDEMDPLDSSGQQTQSYKSAEFLAGQQAGFKNGVEAAIESLRAELIRARCTEDEIKHIIARVRDGAANRT
jgi:hypothetical protein